MRRTTNACAMSEFSRGDEILFQYAGLLTGTVNSVSFKGSKVTYQMTVSVECEVPEGVVVGRESDILGNVEQGEGSK